MLPFSSRTLIDGGVFQQCALSKALSVAEWDRQQADLWWAEIIPGAAVVLRFWWHTPEPAANGMPPHLGINLQIVS